MAGQSEYHSNVRQWAAAHAEKQADTGPLFDRASWFADLHAMCLSDKQALVAALRDGDGAVALPLIRDGATLHALSNWYSFWWRPLVSGADGAAMLEQLARDLRGQAAMLSLSPVPAENGCADALASALTAAGWRVRQTETGQNHWLETAGRTFDAWWAERPGALRSTVQRKSKKGLVDIRIHTDFRDTDWDAYEAVYRASWKPAEGQPDFLRARARHDAANGELRLGIATVGGEAVAAQYWTFDGTTSHIHKLAHVSGQDALSPGTLLTHALFRHAFDIDGAQRIDFGTGDDGYKRDWMEQSAPLMTIEAWDMARPAAWWPAARHAASALVARLTAR